MGTEQSGDQVVLLTEEELAAAVKLFPPGAVSIGGLARPTAGQAGSYGDGGTVDEPPVTKCTTHVYHSGGEIHLAEVCGGGDSLEIVSDTVVGSV